MTQFRTQKGTIINIDSGFVGDDGTQYPPGWLRSFTPQERLEMGYTEIIERSWPDERYYWAQDNGDGTYTAVEKDINTLKSQKIDMAWAMFEQKYYNSEVTVDISAGRYNFGCDKDTIDNISAINTMIARNLGIPNPRLFTPKRALPIEVTHDDFGIIGLALAAQKDALYTVYLTHKLTIMNLTQQQLQTFIDYDVSTGWDEALAALVPPENP